MKKKGNKKIPALRQEVIDNLTSCFFLIYTQPPKKSDVSRMLLTFFHIQYNICTSVVALVSLGKHEDEDENSWVVNKANHIARPCLRVFHYAPHYTGNYQQQN